ncbi:MAG: glycine--tRNA ligase [Candidatus Thorarchaeota archaeon]
MRIEDNIETFNSLIRRRGFIWGPSPEIYGGLAGFYSYGPAGMALKNNILSLFRMELRAFEFVEVECPTIMPEIVWKASGHLDRFTDPIIKCDKCNNILRADKFLKEKLPDQMIDGFSFEEMDSIIKKYKFKCPKCENLLKTIEKYNLMLKTTVGTDTIAYLRPETATTTYLLFNRLNEDARRQYPIKVFQYGKAYRNEISPRQQVLRMRAFDQFEIQLFIGKEQEMKFEEFNQVKAVELPLLYWKMQEKGENNPLKITLIDSIKKKILKKPAFAYCLNIAYSLTKKLGFSDDITRFRQHSPYEMAHYADDAWDLEIRTQQFGWVEICGIHDRTDYDLKQHAKFANQNFEIPMGIDPDKKEVPQILEIAFGPDRIIYTLLETSFNVEDERINLRLNPYLAPNTVAVFPLVKNKGDILNLAKEVHNSLLEARIISYFDQSGSIGKRYRRQDELGTPYCVTIDYESLEDHSVTVRLRDSMEQRRIPISEIGEFINKQLRENLILIS